jgi:hypothetical protein
MSVQTPRVWSLFAALAASPAAWALQLVLDYAVAGSACFPGAAPQPVTPEHATGERLLLVVITLVCLVIVAGAGVVAWRALRGEVTGAHRFLAACGLGAALVFMVAIVFGAVVALTTPLCWRFT